MDKLVVLVTREIVSKVVFWCQDWLVTVHISECCYDALLDPDMDNGKRRVVRHGGVTIRALAKYVVANAKVSLCLDGWIRVLRCDEHFQNIQQK